MSKLILLITLALLLSAGAGAASQTAAPLSALAKMPVKEITVFKDGHAFVLHEGVMPTDSTGNVLMDYLPTPVIGTFWPYSSDKNARLTSVVTSQRRVLVERTALTLRELLEANAGAEGFITETGGASYAATILAVPARSAEELEAAGPPGSGDKLPQKGEVILLKTAGGVKVVPLARIQDVTFKDSHKAGWSSEEFRNLLTLKLDWAARKPEKSASVGLIYLQKGVRWIPSYKVVIDGNGNAAVRLQATLLNELADLEDVTANLVIGVPTFSFKDTVDPIALQQSVAQLSPYFDQGGRTGYALSNAIATQAARMSEERGQGASAAPGGLGPEVSDAGRSEDLFVFTVKHVTLRKGERMVLPVAEYNLKYKDVFTLDLPFAPPPEVRAHLNTEQQAEIARLFSAPKVMHKIRLVNDGTHPLTTAPALLVRGDRVLAQGMMTYTAVGATTDLDVTKAVDIQVKKTDAEVKRTPNAVRWQGDDYARVDLAGAVSLTNYRAGAVEVEVTRHVLGSASSADHAGVISKVNVFEDGQYLPSGAHPFWWGWYSWPSWWHQLNGVARVSWKVRLEQGKSLDLGYAWHYYWR
jgi:hypothetical protein